MDFKTPQYFNQLRTEVAKTGGYFDQLRTQVASMGQTPTIQQSKPETAKSFPGQKVVKRLFDMVPLSSINARDPLKTPKGNVGFEVAGALIPGSKGAKGAAIKAVADSRLARKAAQAAEKEAVILSRDYVYHSLKEIVDKVDLKNLDLIEEAQNLMGDLEKKYEIHNAIRRGFEIIKLAK